MKQLIMPSLSFYLYIATCFFGLTIFLEASYDAHHILSQDQTLSNVHTTLRVIKQVHRDIEDLHEQSIQDNQFPEHDFLIDIMIVLVGTYEKMVGATVTYYLMINMPIQYNLQDAVARIIAEDIIKIMSILGKRFIHFIFDRHMTWKEKLWYCAWIISVITLIKIGIDQIPQPVQPQPTLYNLPNEIMNLQKNEEDKSGYLKEKFNDWK